MITFTTNLTPDLQRLTGWLISEMVAWLLSLSPSQLAVGVWCASAVLAGVLFVGCCVVSAQCERRGQ